MVSLRFECVCQMFSECCLMSCQHPGPASPLPKLPFPPDCHLHPALLCQGKEGKTLWKTTHGLWGSCREPTKSSREAFSLEMFVFESVTNTLEPQNAFAAWFISWIITSLMKRMEFPWPGSPQRHSAFPGSAELRQGEKPPHLGV